MGAGNITGAYRSDWNVARQMVCHQGLQLQSRTRWSITFATVMFLFDERLVFSKPVQQTGRVFNHSIKDIDADRKISAEHQSRIVLIDDSANLRLLILPT